MQGAHLSLTPSQHLIDCASSLISLYCADFFPYSIHQAREIYIFAMAAFLPLSFFAISASVNLVALRASQRCRPALLALFILFTSLSFRYLDGLGLSPDQASVLGLFLLIWTLHTCFVLCLEKHPPCPSWRSAYKMMFNARWLGTEKAVPGTAFSLASNIGTEEVKLRK